MTDLDEEVNARIAANVAAARRLIKPDLPKEKVMSMETVMEQRRKVDEILNRMRERMAGKEGPKGA